MTMNLTKNLQASPGFFLGTLVLVAGSLVGLSAYLLVASAAGWISPIWWGGEALLFPVLFGVPVLVVGGVASYLILRWVAAVLGRRLTALGQLVGGVIIGVLLMPVQKLIASWLTAIPGWEAMAPMASVFVILAIAAICSAITASLLVAFFPRTSA
jgi:MFS family permease